MDKNKFLLGGRLFNTASPRLVAPMQRKARPQVGRPNERPQHANATHVHNARHILTSTTWVPQRNTRHIRKLGSQTQCKASSQDGHPNEKLIHKNVTQGSTAMDKKKFLHRLFNTASPRLGAPTQRKVRPQGGCPNATQGASARWAPKRKTDPQRKRPHKGALG
jgi:hypothetical protein